MPYGIPSGPYYGPNNRWIDHPRERPGCRVKVKPNDEPVFKNMVDHIGTAVRRNGGGFLVYFDNYIDLNVPYSCLERLPTITDNDPEDFLFTRRNQRK